MTDTPQENSKENAQEQPTTTWAERDRFLGLRDQRPAISGSIDKLEAVFGRERQRASDRLRRIAADVRGATTSAAEDLTSAENKLTQTFAELIEGDAPDRRAFRRVSSLLEKQIARLYRHARLIPMRTLERQSPVVTVAPLFNDMQSTLVKNVDSFPVSAATIKARRTAPAVPGGERVCDVHAQATEHAGQSRISLVRRARQLTTKVRLWSQYEVVHVPTQDVARRVVLDPSGFKHQEVISRYSELHTNAVLAMKEAWQIVRSNLDVAIDELAQEPPPPAEGEEPIDPKDRAREVAEIVTGSLTRARERLSVIADPFDAFAEEAVTQIEEYQQSAIEQIRQDVEKTDEFSARMRWAMRRSANSAEKFREATSNRAHRQWRKFSRISRRMYFRAEDGLLRIGKVIGVQRKTQETLLAFADLPNMADVAERTRDLPPIYRRLFSSSPLQSREMLVGRESALETLSSVFTRWNSGRPSSVAVIGPEGSGKTSLLNCFESDLDEAMPVLRCELKQRINTVDELVAAATAWFELDGTFESMEALADKVLELPRRVMILEGGHLTMLRAIGGRRAIEALMFFVLATRARVLWVISFRLYSWRRMDELLNVNRFFSHVVETSFHSADTLQEGLLIRHRSSGLQIRFSEVGVTDRKIRKLLLSHPADSEKVQTELQEKYFETLFQISGGNMDSALFYWLASLSADTDRETIVVSKLERPDTAFITRFDRLYLFTLAEILNNGVLSESEHAAIFRVNRSRTRAVMSYLLQLNLIKRGEVETGEEVNTDDQVYGLNPVFWHVLSTTLETIRILY